MALSLSETQISARDFEDLVSGNLVAIRAKRAKLYAQGVMPDRRFHMTGPSGHHSLLVVATDLNRLNAHWRVFCEHEANQ